MRAVTILEIRKDGVRVALSADQQDNRGPVNQTIFYRETLNADASFDIRVRVANDSILPEKLEM